MHCHLVHLSRNILNLVSGDFFFSCEFTLTGCTTRLWSDLMICCMSDFDLLFFDHLLCCIMSRMLSIWLVFVWTEVKKDFIEKHHILFSCLLLPDPGFLPG